MTGGIWLLAQAKAPLQDPAHMQALDSAGLQSGRHRSHDLVTLGNLCVDIVLEVPELPSPDVDQRKLLLRQLTTSAPPQEVGLAGGLHRGSLPGCRSS